MMKKLPASLKEVLQVALGSYCVTGALMVYCNWHSRYRSDVAVLVGLGLVLVLLGEAVAAGVISFVLSLRSRKLRQR